MYPVTELIFSYWDRVTEDWKESWDTEEAATLNRLPDRVRIEIKMTMEDGSEQIYESNENNDAKAFKALGKVMKQRLRQLKTFWRVLRTPSGARFGGQRSRSPGVALLSVMMGLALMSAVVTEMSYNEMVRYKLAIYERDSVKAESLAHSGLNIARLLAAQGAIQPMLTQLAAAQVPLPAHTLWQLIPLESDLLKGMTSGALQSTRLGWMFLTPWPIVRKPWQK